MVLTDRSDLGTFDPVSTSHPVRQHSCLVLTQLFQGAFPDLPEVGASPKSFAKTLRSSPSPSLSPDRGLSSPV